MRALIVGGGIGGLATASALQRVGMSVAVFEKAPKLAPVGAGLSLWSNAVLALRRLGLENAALRAGSIIKRDHSFVSNGRRFADVDFVALGSTAGAVSICLLRASLQRILLEAVLAADPASINYGKECSGFELDGDRVSVTFTDGSSDRGDVLIGADGIHSVVRAQLFGQKRPRFAGYVVWRGTAQSRGDLADGDIVTVVAPGAQAGCFHCGDSKLYWFVTQNAKAESPARSSNHLEDAKRVVKTWGVPFRTFLEATQADNVSRDHVFYRPTRRTWGAGRVTLLGDAVHPMTPDLGQGACQALEDAIVLADALRRHATPESGLRAYENQRRRRANFVANQSRRIGAALQLQDPVSVWLRTVVGSTNWSQQQTRQLFARLLHVELPELPPLCEQKNL